MKPCIAACRGAIASVERQAVTHVVLQARGDVVLRADIGSFQAAHESRAHHFGQVRIFAERFVETWPHWLPADIKHGRKAPRNAGGARFHRRDFRSAFH